MTSVLLAQLYAIRAQLDAAILVAEKAAGLEQVPSGCPHCHAPEEQLQDTSTLDGTKRKRCSSCGYEWVLYEQVPA